MKISFESIYESTEVADIYEYNHGRTEYNDNYTKYVSNDALKTK